MMYTVLSMNRRFAFTTFTSGIIDIMIQLHVSVFSVVLCLSGLVVVSVMFTNKVYYILNKTRVQKKERIEVPDLDADDKNVSPAIID